MALHQISGRKRLGCSCHDKVGMLPFGEWPIDNEPKQLSVIGGTNDVPMNEQRGSFRVLVRNNVEGIATALAQDITNNPQAIQKWWESQGGNFDALKSDIAVGIQQPAVKAAAIQSETLAITPPHTPLKAITGNKYRLSGRLPVIGALPSTYQGPSSYPIWDGTTFKLNPTTSAVPGATLAADPHWQYFAQSDNPNDTGTAAHIAWAAAACQATAAEMQAIYDWWMGGAQGNNMCGTNDLANLAEFQQRCTSVTSNNPQYNGSLESFFPSEGVASGTPTVPTNPAPCPQSSGGTGGCNVAANAGGILTGLATGALNSFAPGIGTAVANAAGGVTASVSCGASAGTGPIDNLPPNIPPPGMVFSPGIVIGGLFGLIAIGGILFALND